MTTRTASCSCGKLQITVHGEPVRISICHCLACQKRTGSVFGEQARFRSEGFTVTGASTEFRRTGDDGGTCAFHFCPECGATVYYKDVSRDDFIAVPVGAFADPTFPAPRVSVYEERKHAWVQLPEEMEHFD